MEDEEGRNMKDSFVWCPEILESTRIGRRVRPDTKESQKQKSNQVFRPEGSKSADAPSAFPFGSVNRIQFSEPFCMTQEGGVQEKKETFLPGVYFGVGAFVARTKVRQWRKIGDINFWPRYGSRISNQVWRFGHFLGSPSFSKRRTRFQLSPPLEASIKWNISLIQTLM